MLQQAYAIVNHKKGTDEESHRNDVYTTAESGAIIRLISMNFLPAAVYAYVYSVSNAVFSLSLAAVLEMKYTH